MFLLEGITQQGIEYGLTLGMQECGQLQECHLVVPFIGVSTDLELFEPGPHIVVLEGLWES